jgi:hypothetical protein
VVAAVAAVLLVGLVVGLGASGLLSSAHGNDAPAGANSGTSLATVRRQTLSETTELNGLLGYAGTYSVLAQLHGTVTWLPRPGAVISQGKQLFRVNNAPVLLLYGSVPAYRDLAVGVTDGPDVAQLNHDLVALHFLSSVYLNARWTRFGWATRAAVERLQAHLGVRQSGTLSAGSVVFLPAEIRVTVVSATLGGAAGGSILSATSTTRTVSLELDADAQSEVKVGDHVTITLPDNATTPGTVTSIGTVATISSNNQAGADSSTPTVPVTIESTDPSATGSLDQAPVEVAVTDRSVRGVLAVPVVALVALTGGGYAVEVVPTRGAHRLVRVTPGLFDDAAGLVQVSGEGLEVGQRVVVPGQ